jgi:hypothetical protein
MRPIHENTVIQIDITNACHLSCANCTRFVGHHRNPYFMCLDDVRRSIASLDGFPGRIGIMGGEPALHPQFREILALMREMIPYKPRREFWTAGFKWQEYKEDILLTFDQDRIAFNDHTQRTGKHQPLLVAIDEVVEDPELRKMLIDNCPFQLKWSAAITPKGAYFCEIAASQAWLLDGPDGYPIEPGWWRKEPADFQDQVEQFCGKCSGALPMPFFSDGRGGRDGPTKDVVSPGNMERLLAAGSPKANRGNVTVWDKKITAEDIDKIGEWNPRSFRDFEAHVPEDYVDAEVEVG